MDRPQQPELERSGHTPVDQESRDLFGPAVPPPDEGPKNRVPPANRRGHRPPREQDKPVWAGGADREGRVPDASKADLLREAKRLGVRGRTRMTKRQLVNAISSQSRPSGE